MTTDPNWLKSITESYTQEVSQSARNLQEKAETLYNLVETIQTALQVDLTEEQVDALIKKFSVNEAFQTGTRSDEDLKKDFPDIDVKTAEDALYALSPNQRKGSPEHIAYKKAQADNHANWLARQHHPDRIRWSAADPNVDITDSEAGWARRRFGNLG